MRRALAAVVLAAGFTGLVVADDSEKALKELEGVYGLKSLSKGGKSAPPEVIVEFKEMVIEGDKITLRIGSEDKVAKLKLDPSKKPAHIDISPEQGGESAVRGIYQTRETDKGLELTIAFRKGPGGERPGDFKGEGKEDVVLKLLRKK